MRWVGEHLLSRVMGALRGKGCICFFFYHPRDSGLAPPAYKDNLPCCIIFTRAASASCSVSRMTGSFAFVSVARPDVEATRVLATRQTQVRKGWRPRLLVCKLPVNVILRAFYGHEAVTNCPLYHTTSILSVLANRYILFQG